MFSLFKKKRKKLKEITSSTGDIVFTPIYHNDAISIVHDACVICVDGKKERTVEEKVDFIATKVRLGHESILEHTNYIVKLTFEGTDKNDALLEMMDCFKYLNIKTKVYSNEYYSSYTVLIGGSVRGYKHIIRTIKNYKNPIYVTLLDYIKLTMPSCFFSDLIEDGIFTQDQFLDVYEEETGYNHTDYRKTIKVTKDNVQSTAIPLYADPINIIYNNLNQEFDYYELMDFCCINTIFINVSRACSHQLVRHRAGITQLSQRYVDMSDSMKLTDIVPDEVLNLQDFFKSEQPGLYINTEDFLDLCNYVYKQLLDDGIKREDARYFLPNATPTTLYMTFTYRGFLKAYKLRTGKGAQEEIRNLFGKLFRKLINEDRILFDAKYGGFNELDFIKPRYEFEEILAEKLAQKTLKEGNIKDGEFSTIELNE